MSNCTHGKWECRYDGDVCKSQELWDDMHRPDPGAGVDRPVNAVVATSKVHLVTRKPPAASQTIGEDGVARNTVAAPDALDEFGDSVYSSGFTGSRHASHTVHIGDEDD